MSRVIESDGVLFTRRAAALVLLHPSQPASSPSLPHVPPHLCHSPSSQSLISLLPSISLPPSLPPSLPLEIPLSLPPSYSKKAISVCTQKLTPSSPYPNWQYGDNSVLACTVQRATLVFIYQLSIMEQLHTFQEWKHALMWWIASHPFPAVVDWTLDCNYCIDNPEKPEKCLRR